MIELLFAATQALCVVGMVTGAYLSMAHARESAHARRDGGR
jgi:hypothetical protein